MTITKRPDTILSELETLGFRQFAERLLSETKYTVILPYTNEIKFASEKPAGRLYRLLRQLLVFYPDNNKKLNLVLNGNKVSITITDRESR